MGGEIAIIDKIGEGCLRYRGGVAVDDPPEGQKNIHQILRHHHVADAQARKHDLAHGADIKHAIIVIQPL